jgi:hypothetical protein
MRGSSCVLRVVPKMTPIPLTAASAVAQPPAGQPIGYVLR